MRRASVADVDDVARIVNAPSVRPYIGPGEDWYDPTEIIADRKNVLLFDEGGGQHFTWRGPGIFEAHSFYLVRGKEAIARGREAIWRMFEQYGAEMIWRATPIDNRRARWFNRQLGFMSLGEVEIYGTCELFIIKELPCH